MLDIKFIKNNVELVRKAISNKNSSVNLDLLLDLDLRRRSLLSQIESLQSRKNELAREIAKSKGESSLIEEGKKIRLEIDTLETDFRQIDIDFNAIMSQVPNIPSEDTPIGKDDSENVVIRKVGEPIKFDFEPKEHWQLGVDSNLIDTETASNISGPRFAYLKNGLVHLQFALTSWAMSIVCDEDKIAQIISKNNLNVSAKAFSPILPPTMIKPEIFARMARLEPRDERYHIPSDDLYLIGSAEHTLGPIHVDQILQEADLPIRYVGYSTSYRREAGAAGKDTRGILRLHQFDKLEMESFCLPEESINEQNLLVAIQEYILSQLKIPYQVVICCTGDMGDPDARHIDIECWMPGQNKYRETHSADLMTDYQSRRLNTRVKRPDGNEFVHMNDATLMAFGRTIIAIMENYQTADGRINIPDVIKPFMPIKIDQI